MPTVDIPRFWAPPGHDVRLSEDGLLRSPVVDVEMFDYVADPALVATAALAEVRGLVLLGPPGSGKSVELDRLY